MKKTSVAHFGIKYFPSKGGSSRLAESIIRQLKDQYEVTIYCYKDEEAPSHIEGVRVVQFSELPFGSLGVFVYYFICSLHILFFGKYDLINIHKTDSAVFIPLLRLKSKLIATSQEAPYVRDKWSSVGKSYFRLMERFFIRSSAILTSVSQPLANYYQSTYNRQVFYVPNGVDITHERNKPEAKSILEAHNVNGPYILFAARRIMSTKGCHTFLKGLKKIGYKGTVLIAGDGSQVPAYTRELVQLAEGLGVRFIGYVNSKETLLSLVEKADLFVFPSETEGLSLMLLEVASAGTPLICSDIPENTAVFSEEEVCYFRDKDVDDFAEKFTWILNNPTEMQIRAKRASARVESTFSSKVVANQYNQLYKRLIPAT